jgi:hypothetical protein
VHLGLEKKGTRLGPVERRDLKERPWQVVTQTSGWNAAQEEPVPLALGRGTTRGDGKAEVKTSLTSACLLVVPVWVNPAVVLHSDSWQLVAVCPHS